MPSPYSQKASFLSRVRGLKGSTLITVHSRADLDAVCSALALQRKVANSIVYAPDEPSKKAARVLGALGIAIPQFSSLDDFENVIVCDASTVYMLGKDLAAHSFPGAFLVIDHHKHSSPIPATASFIDDSRASCCEVVWNLFNADFTPKEALLLAIGTLDDSAQFKSGDSETIAAFAAMLAKSGESFERVRSLCSSRESQSARIGILKSIRKSKLFSVGSLLVGVVETGAFELDCASALVEGGCDYAFSLNRKEGKLFGVKHSSAQGPAIGALLSRAALLMNGSGGGHDLVGGSRGEPALSRQALEGCIVGLKKSERASRVNEY